MATKADGDSCYDKAAPNEPIFVLRAQDRCAPKIVRAWAEFAKGQGAPEPKVQEAMDLALAMESWQRAHGAKVPD